MVQYDWRGLLDRWNRDLLHCPKLVEGLPADVIRSGWLGCAPATAEQIRAAEERLGTTLPPSYRQFLETTNGWRTLGRWVGQLWSVDEIDWYRARHQDLIDAWFEGVQSQGPPPVTDAEYFVYGSAQRSETMRHEYLLTALEISALGGGGGEVYLLNPQIVTAEGEWEAWFFAYWLPGAIRYRSFRELMEDEYASFKC